jgi:hypothetical protein
VPVLQLFVQAQPVHAAWTTVTVRPWEETPMLPAESWHLAVSVCEPMSVLDQVQSLVHIPAKADDMLPDDIPSMRSVQIVAPSPA